MGTRKSQNGHTADRSGDRRQGLGHPAIQKLPPMAATVSRAAMGQDHANAQTVTINNGFVHLHETAPWLEGDLREIIVSRTASTTTRSIQRRSSSPGSSAVPGPIAGRAHEDGHARAEEAREPEPTRPNPAPAPRNGSRHRKGDVRRRP